MLKLLLISSGFFLLLPFYGAGQSDTLNQTDENGLKQGYWIITGEMRPEKGYCPECIYEEGTYEDDRKNGIWKKYFKDGQTVRLKGTYVNNRPNGPYIKYYESGCVREEGDYLPKGKGNSQAYNDDCEIAETQKGTPIKSIINPDVTFNSLEVGDTLRYYYEDSTIQMEVYWHESVKISIVYFACGEIRKKITYHSSGVINRVEEFEKSEACKKAEYVEPVPGGPCGTTGSLKNGMKFDPNGYNKLYNKDDELWLDGNFRDTRLLDGKVYIYDSDGILTKIEIYKKGKYHSDGVLD